MLLATDSTDDCTTDLSTVLAESASHHDEDAFLHVYYVMVFIACLWFVGKIFQKLGMPALVGGYNRYCFRTKPAKHCWDHGSNF